MLCYCLQVLNTHLLNYGTGASLLGTTRTVRAAIFIYSLVGDLFGIFEEILVFDVIDVLPKVIT